jgi:hypothetical protein
VVSVLSSHESVAHGKRARLTTCSAALLTVAAPLYLLAFGRWGSQIGVPAANIYVSDLLLGLGAILYMLARIRGEVSTRRSLPASGTIFVWLTVTIALFWLAVSSEYPMALRLRDLAPLLYLPCIWLMVFAVSTIGLEHVLRALRVSLWVHASWCLPAVLGLLQPKYLPGTFAAVPAFTPRNDFDGLVFALGVVLPLLVAHSDITSFHRSDVALSSFSLIGLFVQPSRAALLAGSAMVLTWLVVARAWEKWAPGLTILCLLTVALGIGLSTYKPTVISAGVLARLGFSSAQTNAAYVGAQGTVRGRLEAWRKTLAYVQQTSKAPWIGLGPGREIVLHSGAVNDLSGDPTVRAPHSWPVNAYARYGLVGASAWHLAVGFTAVGRRKERDPYSNGLQSTRHSPFRALGLVLVLGITVAGAFGVLIESPFGFMPLILGLAVCNSPRLASPQ